MWTSCEHPFLAICGESKKRPPAARRDGCRLGLSEGLTGRRSGLLDLHDDESEATPPEAVRTPVPDELETIWDAVRRELRRDVTDFSFHIWLEPLEPAACERRTLYVRAPEHIRSWVARPLRDAPRAAARRPRRHRRRRARRRGLGRRAVASRLPFPPIGPRRDGLNPKYTFEQFVIGDGNRLAHAAALAVAELPGAGVESRSSSTARPGSARRTCSTRSATTSRRYGDGLRVRYATVEDVHVRVRPGRPRPAHRRLPRALPRRGRPAARRRPVPRRQGAHQGGALPHLQRAVRVGPAARDHERPQPGGPRGVRGAPPGALRVRPRGRARAARPPASATPSCASGSARTGSTRSPTRRSRPSRGSSAPASACSRAR